MTFTTTKGGIFEKFHQAQQNPPSLTITADQLFESLVKWHPNEI